MRPTAPVPVPLRLIRGAEAVGGWRGWSWPCFALAMLLAFVAWPSKRGLGAIPGEQRMGAFSRSLEELERSCGPGRPGAFDVHCRELASFLAQFDECRGACQELVQRELAPTPTR